MANKTIFLEAESPTLKYWKDCKKKNSFCFQNISYFPVKVSYDYLHPLLCGSWSIFAIDILVHLLGHHFVNLKHWFLEDLSWDMPLTVGNFQSRGEQQWLSSIINPCSLILIHIHDKHIKEQLLLQFCCNF